MKNPTRILIECPELIPSVQVGVLNPLQFLAEQEACSVRFKRTVEIKRSDLAWCDILVSVRGSEPLSWNILDAAKKAGRFVVYFIDDDLLNIPETIPSSEYFLDKDCRESILSCLRESDVLWCVNEYLAKKYGALTEARQVVSRVPVTLSSSVIDTNPVPGPLKILYAGSSDHSGVVQKYISPVVVRLLDEFEDQLDFTFIGADPRISRKSGVHYMPFISDYYRYKQMIQNKGFRIGLAIIEDHEFYRCKYYNKYIEYASIGAIGVYSDLDPYSLVVKNGENGFLCANTYEAWYNGIMCAIKDCRENNLTCLKGSIEIIQNNYNYNSVTKELLLQFPEISEYHASSVREDQIKLKNVFTCSVYSRIKRLWRKNGILILFVIISKISNKMMKVIYDRVLRGRKV